MKVAEVSQQNPKLITFCISVPLSSGINALRTRQLSLKTKPMAEYLLALLTHQRGAGTHREFPHSKMLLKSGTSSASPMKLIES